MDSLTRTNHFFKDLNSFFSWEEIDEKDKNRMPYDKEAFVFKSLVFRNTSFTSVSYTHLDVYKRQDVFSQKPLLP